MSLNLFNYNSSLFSGMSSNSSGMSSMLGDYMAIRNGSYGKLLKAYYSQDDIVKGIMQMQFRAGNLNGYLDYKQFWDFLDK